MTRASAYGRQAYLMLSPQCGSLCGAGTCAKPIISQVVPARSHKPRRSTVPVLKRGEIADGALRFRGMVVALLLFVLLDAAVELVDQLIDRRVHVFFDTVGMNG